MTTREQRVGDPPADVSGAPGDENKLGHVVSATSESARGPVYREDTKNTKDRRESYLQLLGVPGSAT
jgi:hypothetical protein